MYRRSCRVTAASRTWVRSRTSSAVATCMSGGGSHAADRSVPRVLHIRIPHSAFRIQHSAGGIYAGVGQRPHARHNCAMQAPLQTCGVGEMLQAILPSAMSCTQPMVRRPCKSSEVCALWQTTPSALRRANAPSVRRLSPVDAWHIPRSIGLTLLQMRLPLALSARR